MKIKGMKGEEIDLERFREDCVENLHGLQMAFIDYPRYEYHLFSIIKALEAVLEAKCPAMKTFEPTVPVHVREREWGFVEGCHRQMRVVRQDAGVIEE
jgi:hypothetical protein